MSFGFPAYHTDRYSLGSPNTDIISAVRESIKSLSWSLREESKDLMVVSTSMNIRSWGEKVEINFLQDNSLSVTSKCTLFTQCFDWGKNKSNVTKFMSEIKKHV